MYKTMDSDMITVGELGVRFLVEAADTNGSASVFECHVPSNSRMLAPHSHDGFEEIYGLAGTSTGFRTTATPTRRSWRSRPRPCSGPPTSAR